MTRQDPFHPPFEYARLRAEGPVVRAKLAAEQGRLVWLVTRYEEAKQVLSDTRFSSDCRRPGFPSRRTFSAMIRMDPPDHTHYRRMLNGEFGASRIAELRPLIQELTDGLLDRIAAGPSPVDLVPTLAMPLPSLVICHLLGVPYSDHVFLQERTTAALRADSSQAEIDGAVDDLGRYMDGVVRRKARDLGDDLLSRLIADQVQAGGCTLDAAADLARLLLVAGHVTTVNMIGLGILTLLQHPQQMRQLRADPQLVVPAVNELLRHLSITATLSRVATEDLAVGGTMIRAGEGVLVLLSSANRDERAFDAPDEFDIHRAERGNLAFGWGPHICLGASLARLELRVVFDSVLRRFPNLACAVPLDDIPFREKVLIYGVHELPVTW
ncbi:MAG: cytochrome P450 [Myxococcales bacterium]|nr:cytochrome P450 [Myxococcales bacterium]